MTVLDYTERELLWISGATSRSGAIADLEKELRRTEEPLMTEAVTGLLQKLAQMTDAEFAAADKRRADWE